MSGSSGRYLVPAYWATLPTMLFAVGQQEWGPQVVGKAREGPRSEDWKRIGLFGIVSTAISTLVALVVTYSFTIATEDTPSLQYSIVQAARFFGPSSDRVIYTVSIRNSGQTELEELSAAVTYPRGASSVEKNVQYPTALSLDERAGTCQAL